jgi:SAM-dependent methyltransferase
MAHPEQLEFCKQVQARFPLFFCGTRVLEVGSLDLNGSVRELFVEAVYTGLDLGPGPGVDVVCDGADYDAPDGSYDVVLSTEAFEHTPRWPEVFQNMTRLVRSGGLVFMTCASTGRPEHGTSRTESWASPFTQDYYGNVSCHEFFARVQPDAEFSSWDLVYNAAFRDLYFWGIKR